MHKSLKPILLAATAFGLTFLAGQTVRADYSNTVMSFHPVGYWPLNETTAPGAGVTTATNLGTLGTSFNATFQGNVTFGFPGVIVSETDTADGFDGASAQAKTPYTAAGLSNAPSFSVEAWLLARNTNSGNTQCALSDVDAGSTRSGWLLYLNVANPGQYTFRTYNKNGGTASLSLNIGAANSINAGQWYHLVIVVSNAITTNVVYAYTNGALAVGPVGLPAFVPSDGGQGGFTIGSRSDDGFFFNGEIDEVAYYTNALGPTTIAAHYAAATNPVPLTLYEVLVQQSNPILYFRMHEPNNLPVAHNYGTVGAAANGYYQPGTVPGVAGPTFSGLANGLGANNFACRFSPGGTQSSTTPGPGVACAPYNLGLLDEQGTITLSAWIKVPASPVGWFTGVAGRGDSSYRFGLDQSGLPRFADGGNPDITGFNAVNDGNWHLWTGVYDAGSGKAYLYIDTALAGSDTWSPPGGNSSEEFFIGGAPDYPDRNFVGTICQVAALTNALTAQQVQQVYFSGAPSQFAQAVAAQGPIAYWPLNETNQPPSAVLPVPAANLGTLGASLNANFSGDVIYGVPGALASTTDTADSFNGATTQASAPYTSDLSNAPPFTIEAWLLAYDDSTGRGLMCPLNCVDATSPRSGWLIYLGIDNPGQYTFRTYNQNGGTFSLNFDIGASNSVTVGQWYHLAVVVSNAVTVTNVYGYLNGALVAGPTPLPSYVPNDGLHGGFFIGVRSDDLFYFDGAIDEVAYYTNALSPSTILAHYQAGTNPSPATAYSSLVQQSHPILYYRMDEVPTPLAGPYLVPLPVATNLGSLGAAAKGYYQPGTVPGVAGPTNIGFGPNNFACQFSPFGSQSTDANGPGVMCAPYNQALLNVTQALTLAAWVQVPAGLVRWFQTVAGRGDASYRFDVDNAPPGLPHFAAAPNGDVVGNNQFNDGNWHFWVGVFDPVTTSSYLYIDSLLVASSPGSPLSEVTSYFFIGGAPDYNDRNFVGNVCQVAIFTNALSVGQIEAMYNVVGTVPTVFLPTNAFTINQGANGSLAATVAGTPPLNFQWYYLDTGGNTNVATGQTTSTLGLTNVQPSLNGNQYFLVVNNAYGATTGSVATLTVAQGPPTIQVDLSPLSQSVPVGVMVSYSVEVTGSSPFYYQWFRDGSQVNGATNSSYTFAALAGSHTYSCTITNTFGPTTSSTATVVGLTAPAPVITFNGDGTGWTVNSTVVKTPAFSSGVLLLTDGTNSEARSVFFNTAQYIGGFATFFTYQEADGISPLADGATFCIQNSPLGASAIGAPGGDLAFTGIDKSVAFEMNIYNGANGGIGIQFGTNGLTADSTPSIGSYFPTTPVNLASAHPINVRLYYNGAVFYLLLVDATTGASYTTAYPIGDITSIVKGASALIGFTGATGGLNSIQTISNFRFSYTTPPVLSVTNSGTSVVVSWPVSVSTFFALQQGPSVTGPWTAYSGTPPTIVNGQYQATIPSPSGTQFYRLVLQ